MSGEEGIRALPLGLLGEPTPLDLLCFLTASRYIQND